MKEIKDKIVKLKTLNTESEIGYRSGWEDALDQVEYVLDSRMAEDFKRDIRELTNTVVMYNDLNDYNGLQMIEYNGYELELPKHNIQMTYYQGTVSISINGKLKTMPAWKVLKTLEELLVGQTQNEVVSEQVETFDETLSDENQKPVSEEDIANIYGPK